MKRVICWDLWGTLIESTYKGETYEQNLSRWIDVRILRALVRSLLMTNVLGIFDWKENYDDTWNAFSPMVIGAMHPRGRALIAKGKVPDSRRVARLWRAENLAVKWICGAVEAVREMQGAFPNDVHLLVTNTTEPGWVTVMQNRKLDILSVFDLQHMVLSCLLPVAKPDPFVWRLVRSYHPGYDGYWMIGNDPLLDIAVPAAMGWKTILVGKNGMSIADVPAVLSSKGDSR